MTRALAVPAVILALAAGCARQPRPVTVPAAPKPGVAALRIDLAAIFHPPAFANAVFGVEVRSLRSGEVLFAQNAGTLLMPASNMKVITAAVGAERLGWAHTFETRLVSAASVDAAGVLQGDLVIVGAGDPSLGGRPGDTAAVFDAWTAQLRARGVTRIAGRIIGDDNVMDDNGLGRGWAWDDLGSGYATPSGAASFAENVVTLTFVPGAEPGAPVAVTARPAGHGLTIVNGVTTAPAGAETTIDAGRLPGSSMLTLRGRVAIGRTDVTRVVSVDNPTAFTAGVVKAAFVERGLIVDGEAVDIDDLQPPPVTSGAATLASWTSPPMAEILKVLLKVSQNFYAEAVLAAAGATGADGARTIEAGRAVVRETLAAWGVPDTQYIQADGSGLSRYNYLAPAALVRVLTRMYEDPRHRGPFAEALPVAGVDGTLEARMARTPAQGNARAKTGSIANARALSGYVTSADGEPIVFSMIANNFSVPAAEANAVIDRAVARLAAFRR